LSPFDDFLAMSGAMWTDGYIAVDWGTTNRRAWRVEKGGASAEFEDDCGIISVPAGGFGAKVAEIRERLGDLPLVMAGMIGSNRGWVEVPYVRCPAGPEAIAAALHQVPGERAWIVPGLSHVEQGRGDVMRGEETQLFGAVAAGLAPADGVVCHPGTHNKWAMLEDGRVTRFRTVMTGEMFNLLRQGSILKGWLDTPVVTGDAFRKGVAEGLEGRALTSDLFGVRAGILLGLFDAEEAAARTSGLLIGADIRLGLAEFSSQEVVVMGRPELTSLYCEALDVAGVSSRPVDGEAALLAGINAIVEQRA
jgi:2-dehydro-3-deoxygalactonokinase